MERILAFATQNWEFILPFRFVPEMNEGKKKELGHLQLTGFSKSKTSSTSNSMTKKKISNMKRQAHKTETLHRRKKRAELRINMHLENHSSTRMMTVQLQIHCFFPPQP
jgi:hypothetical protein